VSAFFAHLLYYLVIYIRHECCPLTIANAPWASRLSRYRLLLAIVHLSLISVVAVVAAPDAAHAGPEVTVASVEQRIVVDHRELLDRVEAIESVDIALIKALGGGWQQPTS
jgi:hypothetical protein